MSDTLGQPEESIDIEIQEALGMLKPGYGPTGDSPFCVVRNATGECTEIAFYYPKGARFDKTGTLSMRASGYDAGFWTGDFEIKPSHPDYLFWSWIVKEKQKGEVGNYDLETLRKEFDSL